MYTLPIIDIMLPACATALNINIRVWQNDNGFKNVLQFDVYPTPSQKTIHLLYTRTLNAEGIPDASLDPNNLCHHYDALILKSATDDDEEDDGLFPSDEEYMGNSLTQETLIATTTTTSITSSDILTYSNDIEYQVEDVPYHYIMYNVKKSDWYNPFKLDMSLFMNVVRKVVGTCPFNIDGNKIYQMKCDKSTWKEKVTDGRHWQINWGKNQLLNGERRVAKCQGSIVCTNNNCPMFQVHNIVNEASFSQGTLEGSYQCANCLHISERQWCGALRASEWDHDRNIMTVWHQGKHICLLKKPPLEKDNATKMVMMLKNVMRLHLHASKTQLMDLGSQYHLVRGEHHLAELFIKICMKNKVISEQALQEV